MSIQTEVITGLLRLPASAALVAQANPEGRGVQWDAANANLILCDVDTRVEFIVDDIHASANEASVIPFSPERQFRVRTHGTLTGALAKGKPVKIHDDGAGLFDLGNGAGDQAVAVVEEAAAGGGYALVRPIVGGRAANTTAALTTVTHTAPGTPDYAVQALTQSSPFGFVTADEGHTVLSVIANLQARVAQLEGAMAQ